MCSNWQRNASNNKNREREKNVLAVCFVQLFFFFFSNSRAISTKLFPSFDYFSSTHGRIARTIEIEKKSLSEQNNGAVSIPRIHTLHFHWFLFVVFFYVNFGDNNINVEHLTRTDKLPWHRLRMSVSAFFFIQKIN